MVVMIVVIHHCKLQMLPEVENNMLMGETKDIEI